MTLIDKILNKTKLSVNRRKVLRNIYWAVLGKVVHVINALLIGIMVARYLGPDQYGLMNYVISYVMLFSVFASFGLDGIEIRELSKSGSDRDAILGTAFSLRLAFALIAILLILLTLLWFESDGYIFAMVMVYSLMLVCSSLKVIRNYFTSIVRNEYVVKTEITRTVVGALLKVMLLFVHASLTWFIVVSTFDFVIIGGGYLYSYRKKVGNVQEWKFDPAIAKMLLRSSFPLLLSGTAIIIYQKIDAVLIRNMLNTSAVGQFSVAAKITQLSIFVPLVVAQTITPLLVKVHQESESRYLKKSRQFMDIMVWSGVAMATVMCIFAAPAIKILYGEEYICAISVLQIMAWKTVCMALLSASGQLIIIENLQRYVVFRNLTGCILSVLLNLLLIPRWGVVGSATATVVAVAFAGFISHILIPPYKQIFMRQTNSIIFGLPRLFSSLVTDLKSKRMMLSL